MNIDTILIFLIIIALYLTLKSVVKKSNENRYSELNAANSIIHVFKYTDLMDAGKYGDGEWEAVISIDQYVIKYESRKEADYISIHGGVETITEEAEFRYIPNTLKVDIPLWNITREGNIKIIEALRLLQAGEVSVHLKDS